MDHPPLRAGGGAQGRHLGNRVQLSLGPHSLANWRHPATELPNGPPRSLYSSVALIFHFVSPSHTPGSGRLGWKICPGEPTESLALLRITKHSYVTAGHSPDLPVWRLGDH